jgi:hypothetical protein
MRVLFWLKLPSGNVTELRSVRVVYIHNFIPTIYFLCDMSSGDVPRQFQSHGSEQLYPPNVPPRNCILGLPHMFGPPNMQLLNSSAFSTAFSASLPATRKQPSLETLYVTDDDELWAEHHEPPPAGATMHSTPQAGPSNAYGTAMECWSCDPAISQASVSVTEHLARTPVQELIRDGWVSPDGSLASVLPPPPVHQSQAGVMQVSNVVSGLSLTTTVDLTQDQTGCVSSSKGFSCPPPVTDIPAPLHSSVHAKAPPSLPPQFQGQPGAVMSKAIASLSVQGQQSPSQPAAATSAGAVPKFLFHGTRRYVLDNDFLGKRQCVPGSLPATPEQQERRRAPDGSFWEYIEFSNAFGADAQFTWDQAALHFGRWFNHDDPGMTLQVLLSCPPSTEDAFMQSTYAVEDSQLDNLLASAFVNQVHVMQNVKDIMTASHVKSHVALQVLSPKSNQQILALRLFAQKYKLGLEVQVDVRSGQMRWCLCRRAVQGKSKC